jgi:hypothetical protein
MLLWQTSATSVKDVEALAAHARGSAECLLRVYNTGRVIMCERGKAPKGVIEQRLTRLFSGGRFGPEAGPWIFLVGIWTPTDWSQEFRAWYQCEHAPMLLDCAEWSGFQLTETSAKRGCQFYALHRLATRSALDSVQRKRSRATPWFKRLSKNKWFDEAFERVLCHRSNLLWN